MLNYSIPGFSRRTSWNLTPNALAHAVEAHRAQGKAVLDLTASNPTSVGLHYDEAGILRALADPAAFTYRPEPRGLLSARRAVVEYYRELSAIAPAPTEASMSSGPNIETGFQPAGENAQVTADSIVLTVSTSEAYSFVFRLLCDVGDEILVPTPSYPLFEFLAELQDVYLRPYSLLYDHGWHIDFPSLESALTPRSRAIVLVHPNNPTGSYVKPSERERLNEICSGRGLALVVDEVFLDYGLTTPQATFAGNRDALTFTLSGVSKISGLPQMKLAWIAVSGPEEIVPSALSRLEVIADTYLSMNTPIQLAAPALLNQRHEIFRQLMPRVRANLAELDRQLAAQKLCSRLEVEGGWYAIVRVPATRTDEELALALLEKENVLVQPGYFYDFPGEGYIVLSLITPQEEFTAGAKKLIQFVQER